LAKRPSLFWISISAFIGSIVTLIVTEGWSAFKELILLPDIPAHWVLAMILYGVGITLMLIDRYNLKKSIVEAGSRTDVEEFSEYLAACKVSLDAIGTTLGSTRTHSTIIEELLKKDIRIRLLILDPNSNYISDFEKSIETSAIKDAITNSLGFLCNIRKRVPEKSANLEIRTYNYFPNMTMFIRDSNTKNGLIRYEPYRYAGSHEHILYIITKKQKKLWRIYTENFEGMWNKGTPYTCS
jgi:hypothetical protein